MAYEKTVWKNNEAPKINATNLNKIEDGIANAVETDSVARVTNVVSRNLFNLNAISIGGLGDSGELIDTSSVTINNLDVSHGIINFTANSWRGIASDFIKVENGDTFTLNGIFTADNYFHRIAGYDSNKTFKSFFDNFYTFPHNINIPDGVSYIRILLGRGAEAGSISFNGLQLEKSSNATSYTPYLNLEELQEKSNDTGWLEVPMTADASTIDWHKLSCRKINGIVYVSGIFKLLNPSWGKVFATLPQGFRPKVEADFVCRGVDNATVVVAITNNGQMAVLQLVPGDFSSEVSGLVSCSFIADN